MAMDGKLDNFDIVQTEYKHVRNHGIHVDSLVPQTLFPGKRPVIVRFHGGGLTTGDSLFLELFPQWTLDLAQKHGAVIVSPNYRLMPEATNADIFEDMEDFWTWLHLPTTLEFLSQNHSLQLDLYRILTAGESAGGFLSISLALSHPRDIHACTASYPCVDLTSDHFDNGATNGC